MKRAFFLDKDGVLVDNSDYPEIIPADKLLEEDIIEGLKYIQSKGYKLIIISNQPWIAKGRLTKEKAKEIFESVINKLKERGIFIDDYFYCPHRTSDNCDCKKPKNKLILDAAKKHDINLRESFSVGDMDKDTETGKNAGLKTILVLTGKVKPEYVGKVKADFVIKNLNEVNKVI